MFIEEWTDFLIERANIDPKLGEISALFMISSLCGRNFSIHMPFGDIYPNIWVMGIGKSRVSRKTTLTRKIKEAIRRIDTTIFTSDNFTPESFYYEFIDNPSKAYIDDEAGGFLAATQEDKGKSYMGGMKQELCKFYDGETYTLSRRIPDEEGRTRIELENIYFTKFLLLQPSGISYLSQTDFEVGYLNRFIFYFINPQPRKDVSFYDPHPESIKTVIKQLEIIRNIRDTYEKINFMENDDKVEKMWNNFDSKIDKMCRSLGDDDVKIGYLANLPTLLLKLSMLFRLDVVNEDEIYDGVIYLRTDDMKKALNYINNIIYPNFNKFCLYFTESQHTGRSEIITRKADLNRIKVLIEYNQPISYIDLLQNAQIYENELIRILQTLLKTNSIRTVDNEKRLSKAEFIIEKGNENERKNT